MACPSAPAVRDRELPAAQIPSLCVGICYKGAAARSVSDAPPHFPKPLLVDGLGFWPGLLLPLAAAAAAAALLSITASIASSISACKSWKPRGPAIR